MIVDNSSFWPAIIVCFGYVALLFISLLTVKNKDKMKKVFRYSGIEFVWRKFKPIDEGTLPTGVVWAVGIYVALFGLASQRYENKIDLLEFRHTSFLASVGAGATFIGTNLEELEDSKCPKKPEILNPFTVFQSMFWVQSSYEKGLLIRTVQQWKNKLIGADLRTVDLSGAILNEADLRKADLRWTDLKRVNFSTAKLSKADLSWADLSDADFSEADLSEAILTGMSLSGMDFNRASLREVKLMWMDLSDANLNMADLSRAKLNEADLSGADLSWADLSKTDLTEADLSRANLKGADLSYANLSWADLSKTDLTEVDLIRANLKGANLSGAKMRWADLSGAILNEAELEGARYITFELLSKVKSLRNTKGIREDILARLLNYPDLFKKPD